MSKPAPPGAHLRTETAEGWPHLGCRYRPSNLAFTAQREQADEQDVRPHRSKGSECTVASKTPYARLYEKQGREEARVI